MELNTAKEKWRAATTWFRCLSKTLDTTTSATTKKHLSRVGWGAEITVGQERATGLTLPQLLADALLNCDILDLMAECTQMEVDYAGGPTHVHICGTIFANKVTQLMETSKEPPSWFRKRFIDPVQDGWWWILYFPMFWSKYKHWVSIRVDFTMGHVGSPYRISITPTEFCLRGVKKSPC